MLAALGGFMNGVVQFIRGIIILALSIGLAGNLVEATGLVGRAAIKAHQRGGISFVQMNKALVGK